MFQKMTNDFWVGSSVLLLALITIFAIIPSGVTDPGTVEFAELSPAFWPQVIMILLGIIGISIIGVEVFNTKSSSTVTTEERIEDDYTLPGKAIRLTVSFGLLFLTYFCIEYLGMVLSTAIGLISFLLLGNVRSPKMIVGLSLFLPCFLYGFFVYVANVPLPIGDLFYSFM